MRSDFSSPEKVLVAGKAGMNDDPHHGHLDIGQFIVHWQKEYFIRDLGSGGYDEKYFDDARFDYPQASSIGHNVIFVNGEKQVSGKLRKQPYNYEIGGKVEEFRTSDARDYVRMDPTKAYPNKSLKEWKRHLILEKPEITVVLDEIAAEPGSSIEIRFHPGVNFEVQDDLLLLEGKEGKMALVPVSTAPVKLQPGRHACQYVNATSRFFWEDYVDTELTSSEHRTIVATLIVPVKTVDEARQVAASKVLRRDGSGKVMVSFSRNGDNYSFDFELQQGGLVLKK
jgi:hypothetical protein